LERSRHCSSSSGLRGTSKPTRDLQSVPICGRTFYLLMTMYTYVRKA
jgi:hypothetical protein